MGLDDSLDLCGFFVRDFECKVKGELTSCRFHSLSFLWVGVFHSQLSEGARDACVLTLFSQGSVSRASGRETQKRVIALAGTVTTRHLPQFFATVEFADI